MKAALWSCVKQEVKHETRDVVKIIGDKEKTSKTQTALQIRAETMLKSPAIIKGDGVSYIKMNNPVGALPLKMFSGGDNASMEWNVPAVFGGGLEPCEAAFGKKTCSVNVEKYVEIVTATLNPILEPLGVKLQSKAAPKGKTKKDKDEPLDSLDVFLK